MDTWRKNECKYIRHRKIGKFELYIYKCAGYYVLDEVEGRKHGHNITYCTKLEWLLPTYNKCVREGKALRA